MEDEGNPVLLRTPVKRIVRTLPGGSRLLRAVGSLLPETRTPKQLFTAFYRHNAWEEGESRSGVGSTLASTTTLRRELPDLLRRLDVRSMLDVPCGDFYWMREVDLAGIDYVGGDIVDELVARNREMHGASGRRFEVVDLTSTPLPHADLVFCRDCLAH